MAGLAGECCACDVLTLRQAEVYCLTSIVYEGVHVTVLLPHVSVKSLVDKGPLALCWPLSSLSLP